MIQEYEAAGAMKNILTDKDYRKAWGIYIGCCALCWLINYAYLIFAICLLYFVIYFASMGISQITLIFIGFGLAFMLLTLVMHLLDYRGKALYGYFLFKTLSVRPIRFSNKVAFLKQVRDEKPEMFRWLIKRNRVLKVTTYEKLLISQAKQEGFTKEEIQKVQKKEGTIIWRPKQCEQRIIVKFSKSKVMRNRERVIQLKGLFPVKNELIEAANEKLQHYDLCMEKE